MPLTMVESTAPARRIETKAAPKPNHLSTRSSSARNDLVTFIAAFHSRSSTNDPQTLSKPLKCRGVRTICLPDWIVRIEPQVQRAIFLKAAIDTTTLQLCEHSVTSDSVDIETKHRRPTIQKI